MKIYGLSELVILISIGMGALSYQTLYAAEDLAFEVEPAEAARQLLNFGENFYPHFFPGSQLTQELSPFVYRYYPLTDTYLGVVVEPTDEFVEDGVYVLGGSFGAVPSFVGMLTDIITPIKSDILNVAFAGCKASDVAGLAKVNSLIGTEKEWTTARIIDWINDPYEGYKAYNSRELFAENRIDTHVSVEGWKDIGNSENYIGPLDLDNLRQDCIGAHQIEPDEFDIIVMIFNMELGASFGGNGFTFLSKWQEPTVILHEILHALSVDRLALNSISHSNLADFDLNTVSLAEFANPFSVMYGNGSYRQADRSDIHPEFGPVAAPVTTANRWMANVLNEESVCEVPFGVSTYSMRTWGEPDSRCLIVLIPQDNGKTITVELQPSFSSFQKRKLDFLEDLQAGTRYLVGVSYPAPVSPNNTDWAAIIDPTTDFPGLNNIWVNDEILFNPDESVRVGSATLSFGQRSVEVTLPSQ